MMLAIARWSLVHGLSHLLLEGQLGLFGAQGNQHDALIAAVLQASAGGMKAPGAATVVDQPLGTPSTNASN